jgi:hypothetical protein
VVVPVLQATQATATAEAATARTAMNLRTFRMG